MRRTLDSIFQSLNTLGYTHLKKEETSPEEVGILCASNGLVSEETSYHFVIRRAGNHGSKTDWDRIRKERDEKRLKAAVAKKKKEGK